MMAKVGRLRKFHRRDWPGFLNRVVPAGVWQRFAGNIPRPSDPRTRWSAKYVVLCWMVVGWSVQGALTERFREGWEVLARLFPRRRRPGTSYQSLTKATGRLGDRLLHQFWCSLRQSLPQRIGARWRWYGWTVLAVDGSRIDAPRTRSNERGLGRAGRAKTQPQWWVTWVIHLPTALIWDWRQGPGSSSERSHLRAMLPTLPENTLMVADTGFGGFDLLRELGGARVDFLIRCGSNTTLLVEGTRQQIERRGQQRYVYLWPQGHHASPPLALRLIVLKRGGKRVYLLTNVSDTVRLSRPMASELYAARWGVETEYRGLKQTLGRRKVRAQTAGPGGMELAGNILALALLLLQGALALGARAARLSVAAALRVIRRALEEVRYGCPSGAFVAQLRAAVKDDYRRTGSKRARDWPHPKRETPPGPPRLRRPTPYERRRIAAGENGLVRGAA